MAKKINGTLSISKDRKLPNGQLVVSFHIEKNLKKEIISLAKREYRDKCIEELPLKYLPPGCRLKLNGLAQLSVDSKLNREALIAMFVGEALSEYANKTNKGD